MKRRATTTCRLCGGRFDRNEKRALHLKNGRRTWTHTTCPKETTR